MYGVDVVKEPGVAQEVKLLDVSGVAFKSKASKCTEDAAIEAVNEEIIRKALWTASAHHSDGSPDIVMHIWDCGGQPVFLDILSAFLTSRTMFFLLFNLSVELETMYQELRHHKGKVIFQVEIKISPTCSS